MKYYDQEKNRLVYIESTSSNSFWDKHWKKHFSRYNHVKGYNNMILRFSKKYLRSGAKVLEGGCGYGQNVFYLKNAGFDSVGLDYAKETVNRIKKEHPDLKIILGDVRKLPFSNNSFDGYWSLGVIEHFYEGYEDIANEMYRVIKPEGNLFLTFPHMSKRRRRKSQLRLYPIWKEDAKLLRDFYQFALDEYDVIQEFKKKGFKLVEAKPYDGLKGYKDELKKKSTILQNVYDGKSIVLKIIKTLLSLILRKKYSHAILLVFQKK